MTGVAVEYEDDTGRDAVVWITDGEIVETGLFTTDLTAAHEAERWYFQQPGADEERWRYWLRLLSEEAGERVVEMAGPRVRSLAIVRAVEADACATEDPLRFVAVQRSYSHALACVDIRDTETLANDVNACVLLTFRCYSSVSDLAYGSLMSGFRQWLETSDEGKQVAEIVDYMPNIRDVLANGDLTDVNLIRSMATCGVFGLTATQADRLVDLDQAITIRDPDIE